MRAYHRSVQRTGSPPAYNVEPPHSRPPSQILPHATIPSFAVLMLALPCRPRADYLRARRLAVARPEQDGHADRNRTRRSNVGRSEKRRLEDARPRPRTRSPAVVGSHVISLRRPDKQLQSVHCYDRATGKELWKADVHKGGVKMDKNTKSSLASCTPACDGQQIYVNFLNGDSVYATALTGTASKSGKRRSAITSCTRASGRRRRCTARSSSLRMITRGRGHRRPRPGDRQDRLDSPRAKVPNYSSPMC